jgi:hypothetical protein
MAARRQPAQHGGFAFTRHYGSAVVALHPRHAQARSFFAYIRSAPGYGACMGSGMSGTSAELVLMWIT